MDIEKSTHVVVSGLTAFKQRTLSYFKSPVMKIYGLDSPLAQSLARGFCKWNCSIWYYPINRRWYL